LNIFIEIPTWLGDAVMTTPAIENIIQKYPEAKLIIFGSFVSTALFKYHPNVKKIIIDETRKEGFRYFNLFKIAKDIDVDLAFSFRKNFTTKFLFYFLDAKEKFIYKRLDKKFNTHQVIRYNDFINRSLYLSNEPKNLKIYTKLSSDSKKNNSKLVLGINPGATYGSAKRWYPEEFAKTAIELSKQYDIKIFGGSGEVDIAQDIEKELQNANITNYQNLSGKTSVDELIVEISKLNLFITNDSGPMHVAAAFNIPTIAIFGPTRYIETHQWQNSNEMLLQKELECSPCMKRVCPLKHHDCMRLITSKDVISILRKNKFVS
jgi:heptosyltransferase-2